MTSKTEFWHRRGHEKPIVRLLYVIVSPLILVITLIYLTGLLFIGFILLATWPMRKLFRAIWKPKPPKKHKTLVDLGITTVVGYNSSDKNASEIIKKIKSKYGDKAYFYDWSKTQPIGITKLIRKTKGKEQLALLALSESTPDCCDDNNTYDICGPFYQLPIGEPDDPTTVYVAKYSERSQSFELAAKYPMVDNPEDPRAIIDEKFFWKWLDSGMYPEQISNPEISQDKMNISKSLGFFELFKYTHKKLRKDITFFGYFIATGIAAYNGYYREDLSYIQAALGVLALVMLLELVAPLLETLSVYRKNPKASYKVSPEKLSLVSGTDRLELFEPQKKVAYIKEEYPYLEVMFGGKRKILLMVPPEEQYQFKQVLINAGWGVQKT